VLAYSNQSGHLSVDLTGRAGAAGRARIQRRLIGVGSKAVDAALAPLAPARAEAVRSHLRKIARTVFK
jgi:hypothetical protein